MADKTPQTKPLLPRLAAVFATLFVHLVALLFVTIELCSIVPKFTVFFEQADVSLPQVTVLLITLSDFCVRYFLLIVLFEMIVDGAVVVLLAFVATKRRWLLSAYSQLWLFAVIVLLVWINIALCIPIFGLTQPDIEAANTARPPRFAIHGERDVACEALAHNPFSNIRLTATRREARRESPNSAWPRAPLRVAVKQLPLDKREKL